MCQPKPGPRCSAHARTALHAKRVAKEEAEATRDRARAAVLACPPEDRTTREALRAASVAADKAYWESNLAYTAALRDYETTPEGSNALEQAAIRFDEEGNSAAAEGVRQRLADAKETRQAQVADLAMARRHKTRLADPSPEELAALDQADAEVFAKERELADASAAYQQAQDAWRNLGVEAAAADQIEAATLQTLRETQDIAKQARAATQAEARRIYMESGVSERFAGYYAADMAAAASRPSSRTRYGSDRHLDTSTEDEGPLRAMTIKVKRDGTDRAATLAAKAAAETDPRFEAANAAMSEAMEHVTAAKERLAEIRAHAAATVREPRQRALSASSTARYAMEDATSERDRAVRRREDLRARIGSGLGIAPVTSMDMNRVGDEVVRNPDGTTNAYVYDGPSDGFPHGRYIPAVDVTTVHGMSAANALVLENGRKAWLHGHYARSTRGAGETRSGYQQVVLVAPKPGARPLREENMATAGFYTFVDSTD